MYNTHRDIKNTQNNPPDGHSLHIESVTYKTTTTFIHEQSKHKSEFTKKGLRPFLPPMGQITEEEQRQTGGSVSVCMPCKDILFMTVGRAALQCLSRHLQQQASVTPTPHPGVSMQTQGEMSNESQLHAHADRQEGRERRDGKKRETTEKKGSRRGRGGV